MSAKLGQPVSQVRLTNVAVVKLKRRGKRFEIACYKNKVVNWRNGVETDIDEVLQTEAVFSNVSKGVLAKSTDLKAAFGTTDPAAACRIILDKGELQISGKEREAHFDSMFRDVATIVSQKCVNPENNRPYMVTTIERAMHDAHIALKPAKSAKQQAIEVIKILEEHMPIARAKMRLRLCVPEPAVSGLKVELARLEASIESETTSGDMTTVVCQVPPHNYRAADEAVRSEACAGLGVIEVLTLAVQHEGDGSLGSGAAPASSSFGGPAAGSGGGGGAGGAGGASSFASSGSGGSAAGRRVGGAGAGAGGDAGGEGGTKKISCNTCKASFSTTTEHREHFKSDWHRFNLKRKMAGEDPVDEKAFEVLSSEDLDTFFDTLS